MNPVAFLQKNRGSWEALEKTLARVRREGWGSLTKKEIWRLASLYRTASAHLAVARMQFPRTSILFYLNGLVAKSYHCFYQARSVTFASVWQFFIRTFPACVRRNGGPIVVSQAVFWGAALLGLIVTLGQPELASLFLSEETIRRVKRGELWTEGIWNVVPSSIMATQISTNNISVSFMTFAWGIVFGVGTIYLLFVNGVMLGTLFAFTWHYGKAFDLLSFVIAHGPLELTLICMAGAGGLNLARAELFPGSRTRELAMREEGKEGAYLVLGSLPFFVLAALAEGFVSPDEVMPFQLKFSLGMFLLLLYVIFARGFWGTPKPKEPPPLAELLDSVRPVTALLKERRSV